MRLNLRSAAQSLSVRARMTGPGRWLMKLVCLLRGCQWRSLLVCEVAGLHCQSCERCGALRYSQPGQPFDA